MLDLPLITVKGLKLMVRAILRVLTVASLSAAAVFASSYTFTDILPANSSQTTVAGINNAGAITGWYCPSGGGCPVAYTASNGVFTRMLPNGSIGDYGGGLNNVGDAVGQYVYYSGNTQIYTGFEYNGTSFTTIADPSGSSTFVQGINDAGAMVGEYYNGTEDVGFLDTNGVFTNISDPNAGQYGSDATGINNSGEIVGTYYDNANNPNGFSELNGVYTTVDVPGALYTEVLGVNNLGQIVGGYEGNTGFYGFIDSGGIITTIDDPGSSGYSYLRGINDTGELVGEYENSSNQEIAFTATLNATPEPGTLPLMIGAVVLIAASKCRFTSSSPWQKSRICSRALVGALQDGR
jgi:hypothetical protein